MPSGEFPKSPRFRKRPRTPRSAHARFYYARAVGSNSLPSRIDHRHRLRCVSAPKIMDSHSRSASPRDQPRPQHRPPSPPTPPAFDNRAYQHDESDPNHNDSFTSNAPHQNGHSKEPNGESKTPEAVNLELINLKPKNGKDVAVDISTNSYDEYFVPVNEHKKYMRGEKLYVTVDKRSEKGGCKRPLCWTLVALVVAAVIALIVLAATGVLTTSSPTTLEQYNGSLSSARALGGLGLHDDHSTHDHSAHDHSAHDHDAHNNTDSPTEQHGPGSDEGRSIWSMESSDASMYVPKTVEGELKIDNEEMSAALEDPESEEYKQFVSGINNALKKAIFDKDTLEHGDNEIMVEVVQLRKGSIIVTYRIHWKPRANAVPIENLLTATTLETNLNQYLSKNNRMLSIYHVAEDNIATRPVLDLCQINKNSCEYGCEFDEATLEFMCTCPSNQMLDAENPKKCMTILTNPEQSSEDDKHKGFIVSSEDSVPSTTKTVPDEEKMDSQHIHNMEHTNSFDWKDSQPSTPQIITEKDPELLFSHVFGNPSSENQNPEPNAEPNAEPVPAVEPTAEPTAEPDAEPTAEPKPEPRAEPNAEPTAEPKPEPTAEPKPEPTAEPKPEPTAEPKPEPTAEPNIEPTAEPKAEPTAEPNAEPAAEPKAEPTAEPNAEPAAEPKAEPTAEPNAEPTVEPNAEPTIDLKPEPTAEPNVNPAPEPNAESATEPNAEPEAEPTAEPAAKPSSELKTEHSAESTAELETHVEPAAEPSAESKAEPNSESTTELAAEPHAEPAAEPSNTSSEGLILIKELSAEPTSEPTGEPNTEHTIASHIEAKSKPNTDPSTEPEAVAAEPIFEKSTEELIIEPTAEPNAQSATETKPEPSAEPVVETKTNPAKETSEEETAKSNSETKAEPMEGSKLCISKETSTELTGSDHTDSDGDLCKASSAELEMIPKDHNISDISIRQLAPSVDSDSILNSNAEKTTEQQTSSSEAIVKHTTEPTGSINPDQKPFINAESKVEETARTESNEELKTESNLASDIESTSKPIKSESTIMTDQGVLDSKPNVVQSEDSPENVDEILERSFKSLHAILDTTTNSYDEHGNELHVTEINNTEPSENEMTTTIPYRPDHHANQMIKDSSNVLNMELNHLITTSDTTNFEHHTENSIQEVSLDNNLESFTYNRSSKIFDERNGQSNNGESTVSNELFQSKDDFATESDWLSEHVTEVNYEDYFNKTEHSDESLTTFKSTTVGEYIYKSIDNSKVSEDNNTRQNESTDPAYEEQESLKGQEHKDYINATRDQTLKSTSSMNNTNNIEDNNSTQSNNLNVTIYEISNKNANNTLVTSTGSHSGEYDEHEVEMNPFLPEVENNKSLVKILQEGHDLEPANLNETQNENNDESHGPHALEDNESLRNTSSFSQSTHTNGHSITNEEVSESSTEDSFNKDTVKNTTPEEASTLKNEKDFVPSFLMDTDDLGLYKEHKTEHRSLGLENNFKEVDSTYPSVATDATQNKKNDADDAFLSVVPITHEENKSTSKKSYKSENIQELNDISDSPKKSDRRTFNANKFDFVTSNEP